MESAGRAVEAGPNGHGRTDVPGPSGSAGSSSAADGVEVDEVEGRKEQRWLAAAVAVVVEADAKAKADTGVRAQEYAVTEGEVTPRLVEGGEERAAFAKAVEWYSKEITSDISHGLQIFVYHTILFVIAFRMREYFAAKAESTRR